MARQTYTAIMALLKTKLEGIKDENNVAIFKEVFDYNVGSFKSGYPVAVIKDLAGDGAVIDTHRNEREFTFRIDLYQEQSEAGKSNDDGAQAMRDAVDKVMAAFDTDNNLSGNVQRVVVVPVQFDYAGQAGAFIFATFTIKAVDFVNNYN